MNQAIIVKTFRDTWVSVTLVCVAIVAFLLLFVFAMQTFGPEVLELVSKFAWLAKIFEVSLGVEVTSDVSINVLYGVGFTHLVVLALCWGILIAICTKVTVGEIEQGTADFLLTLPVSRGTVYRSTTYVWALTAVVISWCPLLGVWIGSVILTTEEPIQVARFIPVTVNLLALNLAVAGMTKMLACFASRRGQAVATAFAIALMSATLNFLEPFLPVIQKIRFVSLLHYYRPVDVLRQAHWPWVSILTLTCFAVVAWTIGLIVYRRKDIRVA